MGKHLRGARLLLPPLLISAAALGQSRFQETTDVLVVEVPVQVLLGGEPLRDLEASDFELFDGKKRQQLTGFDVLDLTQLGGDRGPESELFGLPAAARRHFLLLFDTSFSSPGNVMRAREAALQLVREGLHPADLVAVGRHSATRGVELVLGFSSDRGQIELAIETLGIATPFDRVNEPLRVVIAELEAVTRSPAAGGGRIDVDALILENLRDQRPMTARNVREQKQGQILALTGALGQVAELLANVPGRVDLVLLSEGFDSTVLVGSSPEDQERIEEIARAVADGQYWRVDSDERFGSGAALLGVTQSLQAFQRAGVSIQTVDIAGLEAGREDSREAAIRQDSLFFLANETGGELHRNTSDLAAAMQELLDRSSVTYVLAFQPTDLESPGFRPLRVKLVGGPRRARVLHRPGYTLPTPYARLGAEERRLRNAGRLLGGGEGGPIAISVLAVPVRGEGEKAYVPVFVEVDGGGLLAGTTGRQLPGEIYGYAFDERGRIHDFFAQAFGLDLARTGATLRRGGFKFLADLELLPGSYTLRILVRNSSTGTSTLETVPLVVPSFDRPTVSSPLFPDDPRRWVLGRWQGRDSARPYPFAAVAGSILPAARPRLRAGDEVEVYLPAFNLGEDPPTLAARMLSADSPPTAGGSLVLMERVAGEGPELLLTRLRLPDLPGGLYRWEVTLEDPASGDQATTTIGLEIAQ